MEKTLRYAPAVYYSDDEGLSPRHPVVIFGAWCEIEGIGSEYAWLRDNYEGCEIQSRGETEVGNRLLDWYVISVKKGRQLKRVRIWFDATEFYGGKFTCH